MKCFHVHTAESHPEDGGVGEWEEQRDEGGFALHTAWMPDLLGGTQVHRQTKENTKTGNQIPTFTHTRLWRFQVMVT